jgi:hypothetical protein
MIFLSRDDEARRQDTIYEDEAEAKEYFRQYLTASFHPVDTTADNSVRWWYHLRILSQSKWNRTWRHKNGSPWRKRDHRRTRYKTRFWPLYAMSYHKAKRASQPKTNFRMTLSRKSMMKLGSHDVNAYTYERRIWPTQLGGQLWGTRDSFVPAKALSFDNSVRTSTDVVQHLRPSSSYNRF